MLTAVLQLLMMSMCCSVFCRAMEMLFFPFPPPWESYATHVHATKETTSVKQKAIRGRSCKLPHYLGRGRHKSLQRGNMSLKISSLQGSCSPAYSQACSFQQTKHQLCLTQPNIAVKITSTMKCQAKQAADKTVLHHQYAKLASLL